MEKLPDDTLKVNELISISLEYCATDPKESILFGEKAIKLSKEIRFPKGLGYAYKSVGFGYYYLANYSEAVVQFQNSLNVFDSLNFKVGIANILSNLGNTYFNVSENTKAIEFQLQSLKISEELNDSMRIGTALNGIGAAYNNGNPETEDLALEYFLRALTIFNTINYEEGIGTATMNIGEIFMKKNMPDSAISYLDESLKVYSGTRDSTFPLIMLGEIYGEMGDFDQALMYQKRALEIARELEANLEIVQSLLSIAKTKEKQKNYNESIEYYHQAEDLADKIAAIEPLKDVYKGLASLYASRGNYKSAYSYDTMYSSVKDLLYNSDNDKKIQQMFFNNNLEKKQSEIGLLTKDKELQEAVIERQRAINYATAAIGVLLILVIFGALNRYRHARKTNSIIKKERDRSKELLLNILPEETAHELETSGFAKTHLYESVTVLFTDFKGFSSIAANLTPQALVGELNIYFCKFDQIVDKYGLEKIKTIGDAYMCAGGIPVVNNTHPLNAVKAALEMQAYMEKEMLERESRGEKGWELRVGIHTGSIVAGVVGQKKYAYDIWGDTVNVASRMESGGEPGKVNISASTYELIKDKYECEYRGKISAKNIGEVDMYFVGAKVEVTEHDLAITQGA
ncbi:MAG: tetratricopeptide repeat protein [Cyclobacteriaceae bacterium]|nr:tetratricopeptide repeat protein [Cyclobacteriaceae bacterium]